MGKFKKENRRPVGNIIATFTTTKQIGPQEWEVFPVSQVFPSTATLAHVCEWFFRQEPTATVVENIHISQPEPTEKESPEAKKEGE